MASTALRRAFQSRVALPLRTGGLGIRRFGSVSKHESLLSGLSSYPSTSVSQLDNGLRVASEPMGGNSETATVGVWIDTGSRYETSENNGVAHFLEHMFFKGTSRRTRTQLETEIENMGGHLNAYTSREQTVFYAKVRKNDVPQAMDILSDMLTNSNYTPEDIDHERRVILREMEEVEAQVEELIYDRLHETAYRGTPLSKTILGPVKNIQSITREQIHDYISRHYVAPRMVVAAAGAVNHDDIVKLADKHFSHVPRESPSGPAVMVPAKYTGSEIRVRFDDMVHSHIAYAFPVAGWNDPDNFNLMVIREMLGNWDNKCSGGVHSSSPMIAQISEQDLAIKVNTFNSVYSDTGLFGVYAVSEAIGQTELMCIIANEITALCYNVDETALEQAKNNLKMSTLAMLDGTDAVCEDIGRSVLTYGRRMHPTEVMERIEAVDANAIKATANRYFYDRDPAVAAIGCLHELPDYNRLRRWTYQLRF